jgi:histidinol-phosphate aminotransferase
MVRYDACMTLTRASAVRREVQDSPDYPFAPIEARVKLDQNESAHDFPTKLKRLALERLEALEWNRYPDLHTDTLREKIAQFEAWQTRGVVVTPGSNVLIHALAQVAGINQRVLTVSPSFSLYALGAKLLGSSLKELPLENGFALPLESLLRELRAGGPGIVYLAEPHAPTGTMHPLEQLEQICAAAGPDWIVVIDEAYHGFSARDHKDLVRAHANVCVLRTFSKAWGLAGARLGYLLAQPELATNVQKVVSPFNVSHLNAIVAQVALEHPQYMQALLEEVKSERERVYQKLLEHPTWTVYPSQANFLLFRTPDAKAAHAKLLEHGVLIRRQDSYPGLEGCLRVSIGKPEENTAFLEAAFLIDPGVNP